MMENHEQERRGYFLLKFTEAMIKNSKVADFYRLKDPEELSFMGLRDYFESPAIHFIEWPEKGESCLPLSDINCSMSVLDDGRRELTLNANSKIGQQVIDQC